MICRDHRCIFVHVPKTAGMSIEHYFLRLAGLTWETREPLLLRLNDDPTRGPARLAHLFATEYVRLGYIGEAEFNAYFKFSFVRNPWARLVSEYRYRHYYHRFSFREFVAKGLPEPGPSDRYRHIVPQYDFLHDSAGKCLVDFVGRFETLREDFAKVCARLGLEDATLPFVNAADRQSSPGIRGRLREFVGRMRQPLYADYRDYYDRRLRDAVGALYAKDIEAFGYSFGEGR